MKKNNADFRFVPGKGKLEALSTEISGNFDIEKEVALAESEKMGFELDRLQTVLYAQHKYKILIILQGTDTAGKDGTIRNVFKVLNPQGVRVANFKTPDEKESSHDFLWRIHHEVPQKGEIVIFNRSQYEDVLFPKVHKLIDSKSLERRYEHINAFEKMLSDEGTVILKFFLHISKKEQAERLKKRLQNPDKRWKFNPGDLKERKKWNDYREAYEEALSRCHTEWAPWYVIPADRKWYRNFAVSKILVENLQKLKMTYPRLHQTV